MNSCRLRGWLVIGLLSVTGSGCHIHLVLGPNQEPLDEPPELQASRDTTDPGEKSETRKLVQAKENTSPSRPKHGSTRPSASPVQKSRMKNPTRITHKRSVEKHKQTSSKLDAPEEPKQPIQLTQYATSSDRTPQLLPATLLPRAKEPTPALAELQPAPAALEQESQEPRKDKQDEEAAPDAPPAPTSEDSDSTAIELQEGDRHPLNLTSALQLAGANSLQIAMAAEHVRQAVARLDGAEVMWIPTLNLGVGYNAHVGRIQATNGSIVEVNRQSLFAGGGALLQGAPLTGGSGGPARLFVDISPADIYFEPLAARQARVSAQAAECATFNDTLLNVAVAWLELQQAQSELAIADEAIEETKKLVDLTQDFAKSGAGLKADVLRAAADLADRRRQRLKAQEQVAVVSTNLARLLRLPPEVELYATDSQPAPLELISAETDLDALVGQAVSTRPELMRDTARVEEANHRARQERWRPWLPNLHVGVSSGVFGGGPGSSFDGFSDRTDFDALAVWKLQNLGFGNQAIQDERVSQHRAAYLAWEQSYDNVVAEVTRTWKQTRLRRQQVDQAAKAVESASEALSLNFEGIRGRELRPIEAQQAITALANARREYLAAIVSYNQSQFALLRSVGETPQ